MSFESFLEQAKNIVSEHRAEYSGEYHMKGGILGKILNSPITKILSDVALTATGNPEFIPLVNAAETTGGDLAQGKSIGKSLKQGAISGGTALAGQELAGAVGIGTGNSIFNDALGITGDNPAGTGLPDIGGGISNLFSSASNGVSNAFSGAGNALGLTSPAANTGLPDAVQQALGSGSAFTAAPTAGGGIAGGGSSFAASGGAGLDSSGIDQLAQSIGANGSSAPSLSSTAGSAASSASGGVMDKIKQALGIAAPAAGLGSIALSALKGNTPVQGESAVNQQASQLSQVAAPLVNDLATGKLPPGAEATIDQQTNDAINSIKSKYASMGLSGSDMERQAIQAAQSQATQVKFQYAQQATQTGLQALGASDQVYQTIMQNSLTKDQELQKALAAFAGSAAGGKGTTINL